MHKLLTILVFLTSFFLFSSAISYTQDDVREELNTIERERIQKIEEQLLLNLPEISDNPNHILTFKDPSGKGVSLEIDAQGFEEITSPYTLPSLSLGRHILTFKFKDLQETEQTFEKTITIIPRPAVLNPPSVIDNVVKISGTAMANSEVEIFLSSGISNQKALVQVNENGEWENSFTENIEEGIYTALATTRRNGYSSYYSEPIVFEIGTDSSTVNQIQQVQNELSFKLTDIKSFLSTLRNNNDLLIVLSIFFLLGAILAWLTISIASRLNQRKSKKILQEIFRKKDNTPEQPSSFKDKFENGKATKQEEEVEEEEDKKKDEEEVKEEEKEEKEKPKKPKKETKEKEEDVEEVEEKKEDDDEEAKTLTKKEFLERFKDFDPDDEKGKEKDLKKKNIKISLTSRD